MPPSEPTPPAASPSRATECERALDAMTVVNAGYVAELYEQFRRDPSSVEGEWRAMFESGLAPGTQRPQAASAPAATGGNGTNANPAAQAPSLEPAEQQIAGALPSGATPIKGPAARLAQNMAGSLAVPTATSFRDIPVPVLEERRRALNAQLAPTKVSFTHLIGWAIVRAAAEQPGMTHYFVEADGAPHRVDPGAVNLGLAVDVERADGSRFLVVPVIKAADSMTFAEFRARSEDGVEQARGNKLSPDDYVGATITLTNPGTLGTTASVPRLMPGPGTIVATGAIRDTGSGRVMTITSTYDHRIIQGAESGSFLRRVEGLLAGADDFYGDVFSALGAQATAAPAATSASPAAASPGCASGATTS